MDSKDAIRVYVNGELPMHSPYVKGPTGGGNMPLIGVTCDFETIIDSRGKPAPRYWLGEVYIDETNG